MAGILDKKSRFLDYVLTENGRSQIQNNDIRFYYATFSDRSIVYKEKDLVDLNSKVKVSDELCYLPFESDTVVNDNINPEFSLKNFIGYDNDSIKDLTVEGLNFEDAIVEIENNISIGQNLLNLKCIESRIPKKAEGISFVDEESVKNNNKFRILNSSKKYPTTLTNNSLKGFNLSNLPTLCLDKRFSHKNNFKRLIPENSQGQKLYDEFQSDKLFENTPDFDYVISNYNNNINFNDSDTRNDSVIKTINDMIDNAEIVKKVYHVSNQTNEDLYILDMHEIFESIDENNNKKLINNKLSFIDLGIVYNKNSMKEKRVFLIGKVVNTRNFSKENNNEDENEVVFSFNKGNIQKNSPNKAFLLSNFYSFLCMYTLVAE
tara:strand:+ start:593 stop:1720 length:1128 start_codon:yes stop_codon:yes gene_type:complete